MKPYRRLSMQLTPLFDLMLIVIFAQYLAVQDRETVAQQTTAQQIRDLQASLDALQLSRQTAEHQWREADRQVQREREELKASQSSLDRTLDQQRLLGELVVELFQIPPEDVARILDRSEIPAASTPADKERIKQRFRELSSQRAGRMIQHLLSYEEIRKRCDVWELHVDAQGVATLTADQQSTKLRIPVKENGDVAVEQLVSELVVWYRALPQPKSLVVILLTYDRASRIYVTEAVRLALPAVVSRMQADSAGRTRFEYADLGFRLD